MYSLVICKLASSLMEGIEKVILMANLCKKVYKSSTKTGLQANE